MICLVLAAGYATRLYPLTQNYPKPLLQIKGKAILDWLIDDIELSRAVSEYIIISNHKFAWKFIDWAKTKPYKITVFDDGTETNQTRLGAVKDLQYAVEELNIDDDALVIAGDNLLDFSMADFISYAKRKKTSCVMRYYEPSVKKLKKCGVLSFDNNDLITDMTEKSPTPATNWCCPPFYFYTKEDLKLIEVGIKSGCGTDAPGSFIAWLCKHTRVHAMELPGKRYDIGNLESYEQVKKDYKGITINMSKNLE